MVFQSDILEKDSILNQRYPYFELLIINDGSTDNSRKIVQSYQDNRIRIIDKENGGLSSARNAGVRKSEGKYIYFLDSDDYVETETIELERELKEGITTGEYKLVFKAYSDDTLLQTFSKTFMVTP